MNKQAMLNDIYNQAMSDELEKLGFKFLKKFIKRNTVGPTDKIIKATNMTDVQLVNQYKTSVAKIKAATAAGKSVY